MSNALNRQQAMAASRFPPARSADDAQSESGSSWLEVAEESDPELKLPPANLRLSAVPENAQFKAPPPQFAPATQAAQGLLNHDNETSQARRLRKAQEAAARRGRRAMRWGQMGGGVHNAVNSKLPNHISQVGSGEGERSVLILDSRDQRLQSPYQGWLVDEILVNAHANLNVVSDRNSVRSPNTGYHMNLFLMKTLNGMKVVMAGSMTSYSSVPCGRWDSHTAEVLSHEAFQPFRWPIMYEDSPTWIDVKVKVEGALIVHLELRGFRSDTDMTVQLSHVHDMLGKIMEEKVFIPTFIITIFQGWRVVAVSWEIGGRLYACSDGGVVVALDYPLCHFECRFVAVSSPDAFGMDADRLEFRFLSGSDRLDTRCSVCEVPPSWLVVSRVSGPTLITNAKWCREHFARVESPDQALQMSQLASIHAHWTASTAAPTEDQTGPRISAVSVESNPANLHLICESPWFKAGRSIVTKEALALQSHDASMEAEVVVRPPLTDGPSVVPAAQVGVDKFKALTGDPNVQVAMATPVSSVEPSVTAPGVALEPGSSWLGNALAPPRRSMEQRRSETMDHSAWTPAAFVQEVERAQNSGAAARSSEEIEITYAGSLDGSQETASSKPQSFGPQKPYK